MQTLKIRSRNRTTGFARLSQFLTAALIFAGTAQAEVLVDTIGGGPLGSSKAYGKTDGNTASASRFNGPSGLVLDSAGNLYLADKTNNLIRKISQPGDIANSVTTTYISLPSGSRPVGVAVDSSNSLYVLTQSEGRLRRYNANRSATNILSSTLVSPTALALDTNNNIFITQLNGTVQRVSATGVKTEVASGFNQPQGIAVLENGLLVISDTGNSSIRLVNPANGDVTLFTGGNGAGFVDGPANMAKFNKPQGITRAPTGILVVADRGNHRVRLVNSAGAVTTLYGIDPSQWASSYPGWLDGNTNMAAAHDPVATAIATNGLVFVAEYFYHLLRDVTGANLSVSGESGGGSGLPPITEQPRDQAVAAGTSVSFNVTASGTGLSYQWYYEQTFIPGANTNVYSIGGVRTNDAGRYTVRVMNTAGTTTSRDAVLLVTAAGTAVNQTNSFSFGFASGEGSADFVGAAGQHYYAPVTASLVPGQKIYTFQFNVSLTNLDNAPATGEANFNSRVLKPLEGSSPPVYTVIHPNYFDSSARLMTVAWNERYGYTNLYNTLGQDLVTFSRAHNRFYNGGEDGKVIFGLYGFDIPSSAVDNDVYEVQAGRPSGTTDGIQAPLGIQLPTDGSLGAGKINSIKQVRVDNSGERKYIVGDSLPFRWMNAGEFGDGYILNSDIMQIFQSAMYQLNYAPAQSDFFDVMDASDGTSTNALSMDDSLIDSIQFGDGQLMVDDIYVTYRRSLDPTLKWYARYWSGGVRNAVEVPNTYPAASGAAKPSYTVDANTGAAPFVTFIAGDVVAGTNRTITVPIRAEIKGTMAVRIAMFNFSVEALENSPGATSVQFNSVLGTPAFSDSQGANNYSGAWLNRGAAGIYGTNNIGTLTIHLPANAPANAAYRIKFDHASASPNGLGIFPQKVQSGLLTVSDRAGSSLGDGIADAWRLQHFGSVSNNLLAAAAADADGDGLSNAQEYLSGTDPNDTHSRLAVDQLKKSGSGLKVFWPTVAAKQYVIDAAGSLSSTNWASISGPIIGTGELMEFTDTNAVGAARFYRVHIAP